MIRKLATALALNRIVFGLGFVISPGSSAKSWIGARAAARPQTQVFTRALGARDLALGAGALNALVRGGEARPWMLGHAIADGTDAAATLIARRDLPPAAVGFALAMALGSTALGAWSALTLDRNRRADEAVPVG
jgi:hypothetical protein